MTPTPCATCGYPINPGALHYANDRGSHHSTCGDPLGMKATAGRIAELEPVLCFWIGFACRNVPRLGHPNPLQNKSEGAGHDRYANLSEWPVRSALRRLRCGSGNPAAELRR